METIHINPILYKLIDKYLTCTSLFNIVFDSGYGYTTVFSKDQCINNCAKKIMGGWDPTYYLH